MFTGVFSSFPPLFSLVFFLREFFPRALLSERLEQAKHGNARPIVNVSRHVVFCGPKMEHSSTPDVTGNQSENAPPKTTR